MSKMDEHISDEQLSRMAAAVLQPPVPRQSPPPRPSAAQLRAMAEARRRGPGRHRRVSRLAAVAAVVLVVTAGVTVVSRQVSPPAGGAGPAVAGSLATPPDGAASARALLTDLATRASQDKTVPAAGRFTYVHTQSWSRETTPGGLPPRMVSRDERLWWASDRSGQSIVTPLRVAPPLAGDVTGPDPAQTLTYRRGEVGVVVPQPASDPGLLSSQLDEHEPVSNGPQALVRSVASLYRYHVLSGPQRAAAVTVLANTVGVQVRESAVDRLGRTGIAVIVDSDRGKVRDVLLLDRGTGAALSHERFTTARGRAAVATDYVIFLQATRTDVLTS